VHEVHLVLHRLGGEPVGALSLQVAGDPRFIYPIERPVAKEGLEMTAYIAAVVLDRRALSLHHVLQVVDVQVAGLGDGASLAGRAHDGVLLHAPAHLALGLGAREPIARAARSLRSDAALYPPAGGIPLAVPGLPSYAVGLHIKMTGPIGPSAH